MSVNITRASREWASRPDDQRFLSLAELHQAVEDRGARSVAVPTDLKVSTALALANAKGETVGVGLRFDGYRPMRLSNWSLGQLATAASVPAGYLRRLDPVFAADNLN